MVRFGWAAAVVGLGLSTCAFGASFQGLGDLAGGTFLSEAFGVSADGSVVVGQAHGASGYEAFRWTQSL